MPAGSSYFSALAAPFTATGTGAFTTTVDSKLRQTALCVTDFENSAGVRVANDSSTDNTIGIGRAITAALAQGKALYFPGGTGYYRITDTLTILSASGLTMFGDGCDNARGSIIRQTANNKGVFKFTTAASDNNIWLSGLRLEATGTATTADSSGIEFDTDGSTFYDECRFDNIYITGFFYGWHISRLSNSLWQHCDIQEVGANGIAFYVTTEGACNTNVIERLFIAPNGTGTHNGMDVGSGQWKIIGIEGGRIPKMAISRAGVSLEFERGNIEDCSSTTGIFDVQTNGAIRARTIRFLNAGAASALPFAQSASGAVLELDTIVTSGLTTQSIGGTSLTVIAKTFRAAVLQLRVENLAANAAVAVYPLNDFAGTPVTLNEALFEPIHTGDIGAATSGNRGKLQFRYYADSENITDTAFISLRTGGSAGSPTFTWTSITPLLSANTWTNTQTFSVPPSIIADSDGVVPIGRMRLGNRSTDEATLSHYDRNNTTDFNMTMFANGAVVINSASGQNVAFYSGGLSGTNTAIFNSTGVTLNGVLTRPGAATPIFTTSAAITSGAGVSTGTLTNAPAAGNPTKWIPVNDNGTTRYIPAW